MRVCLVGVAAALVLAGCANSAPSLVRSGGSATEPASVKAWDHFPVDANPRPLVLTGDPITGPATGFPSDDAKIAFISGRLVLAAPLPNGPTQSAGYPLMSAANAFAALKASGNPANPASGSLHVVGVELGTAPFSTDRGNRELPAWRFALDGVTDPVNVLAVDPAQRWPQSGMPTSNMAFDNSISLSPDGKTITLTFYGAAEGTGPCTADYTADTFETSTAVSIHEIVTPSPSDSAPVGASTDTPTMCTADLHRRTLTVALTQPLGNRVVVDEHGAAIAMN